MFPGSRPPPDPPGRPTGLDVSAYRRITPALEVDIVPSHWFANVRAYNRLKILPFLYRRYSGYEYMLTCELDAFVFKDELEYWCEKGWDYIGAPWFEGHDNAAPGSHPIGVGNLGFSLRRISTILRVMRSWKTIRPTRYVTGSGGAAPMGCREDPGGCWVI